MSTVVAGRLGNVPLPVPLAATKSPFPAPELDAIGSYLTAYLRAYVGARWKQVAPGADSNIVKAFHTHDPEQYDFNADHLPALYIFGTGSEREPERTAEDWRVHTNGIRVLWILPNVDQFQQAARSRALAFVADTIDHALELGRDPCWVVEDDPDPTALEQGSVLLRHAGLKSLHAGRWTPGRTLIRPWSPKLDAVEGDLFDSLTTKLVFERVSEPLLGVNPAHPEFGEFGGASLGAPASLSLAVSVEGLTLSEATFPVGYAMLYVQDGADAETVGTTPAKLECFTGAGVSAGIEPDHANDRITITTAGVYDVQAAFSVLGTAGRTAELRLRKNSVEVAGLGGRCVLAATVGPLAFAPGLVPCDAGDVLEVYAEASVDATSLTVVDGSLVVTRRN